MAMIELGIWHFRRMRLLPNLSSLHAFSYSN